MNRTVYTADSKCFEIGMDYDLPDALAEAWVAFGVADRQEAPVPPDPDDPGPIPPRVVEGPDAAVRGRVKKGEL